MAENDNSQEVGVEGPGGFKFKARGTDLIAIIVLVTGVLGVVLLWMHMNDAKADAALIATASREQSSVIAAALKEIAATNKELVGVQRVTNCLISVDTRDRRSALLDCERIAR